MPWSQASCPVPWSQAMHAVPWGQALMAKCPVLEGTGSTPSVPPKFCQQHHSRTLLSHSEGPWKGCECGRAGIQAEQARAVLQQPRSLRELLGHRGTDSDKPAVCHMARQN